MVRVVVSSSAAVLAALALSIAAGGARAGTPQWVTLDGVGGVVPGMPASRVHALWGIPLPPKGRLCSVSRFRVGSLHGYALFLRGRFGSVFFDAGAVTADGVGVGTPLAKAKAEYGKRLRHQAGSSSYFLHRVRAPRYQIRFDVDRHGTIDLVGFGDASVHFVGGCGYTRR
jgi:hypothetical protein